MELNQLRYFAVVAETENLTKAAQALFITQPALSRAISKLEKELGVTLFDRKAHSLILNANGETFLRHVSAALEAINTGVDTLRQMNQRSITIATYGFLGLFSAFCDQCLVAFPEIDLVEYDGGKDIVPIPAELAPDLILTPIKNEPGYIPYREYTEHWCVVYHKDYRFRSDCDGRSITREQLQKETVYPGNFTYEREFVVDALGESCCAVDKKQRSPRLLIGRCQALGVLPVGVYQSLKSRVPDTPIRAMPIAGETLERKLYLSYRMGSQEKKVLELLDLYIQKSLSLSEDWKNSCTY